MLAEAKPVFTMARIETYFYRLYMIHINSLLTFICFLDFIGFCELRRGDFLYHLCASRANAEIAQVRAKAKQEQAASQASLRKEQMKVDSLERTLEQKVSFRI